MRGGQRAQWPPHLATAAALSTLPRAHRLHPRRTRALPTPPDDLEAGWSAACSASAVKHERQGARRGRD